jgi:hypothetical protein
LSAHDQESIEFISEAEDPTNNFAKSNEHKISFTESRNREKTTGALLVGISVVLAGLAVYQLV